MVRQNIDTGQNQGIVSMTELHIYALKGLAHPRRNTHRDQKCVNSTRVSNPVLVYYLWVYQCILDCIIYIQWAVIFTFLAVSTAILQKSLWFITSCSSVDATQLEACTRLLTVRALHLRTTCACAIKQTWLSLYIGNHDSRQTL